MKVDDRQRNAGEALMSDSLFPTNTGALAKRRKSLTPDAEKAFKAFSQVVFAEGALDEKTKHLIAVAVAHVTQCPYCIKGHTKAALRLKASDAEIMEAIWVAAEMRAGGAYAHSVLALDEMEKAAAKD
jgi:AhpD family alkylhydroperoxidase